MSENQQHSLCLFCLKPSVGQSSEATGITFLRVFSRFLNIHPDFEQNCETICEHLVSCGDCTKRCEKFSKLFFEWEQKGLLLTSMVGEVFDVIKRSKLVPSQPRRLEQQFEEAASFTNPVDKEYSPIKEVRQVLLEHCEQEVMNSFPKVRISIEEEQRCLEKIQLERKKKMGGGKAPPAPVPIKRKKLTRLKRCDSKNQATSAFQDLLINCPICRYSTRRRGALGNHLSQVHKRVLALQCQLCTLKLQTVDGFRRHMLHLHGKEFETKELLMSKENVSYSCFDTKWVAGEEEELGLNLPDSPLSPSSSLSSSSSSSLPPLPSSPPPASSPPPSSSSPPSSPSPASPPSSPSPSSSRRPTSSSSSSSSSSSKLFEMEAVNDSTPSEVAAVTNNSEREGTDELQLQSSSPPDEEKLPEEKAKRLGHECKICHKKYTNQRTLETHMVYRHKDPPSTLSGEKRINRVPIPTLSGEKRESVVGKYKCPEEGCKLIFTSMLQLFDHFHAHPQQPKNDLTRGDVGGSSSTPTTETGTVSENQPAPDSEGETLNGGFSGASMNNNDYSGPIRFGGISEGDSSHQAVNGEQDNYPFKCSICVFQAVNKAQLNAHMKDHF